MAELEAQSKLTDALSADEELLVTLLEELMTQVDSVQEKMTAKTVEVVAAGERLKAQRLKVVALSASLEDATNEPVSS